MNFRDSQMNKRVRSSLHYAGPQRAAERAVDVRIGQQSLSTPEGDPVGPAFERDEGQAVQNLLSNVLSELAMVRVLLHALLEQLGVRDEFSGAGTNESTGSGRNARTARTALLRRESDVWFLRFGTEICRVRDCKGLRYLALLVKHPGKRVHVAEMLASISPADGFASGSKGEQFAASKSDLEPLLDSRALRELQARLQQVEEELDEAQRANDLGQQVVLHREQEWLRSEIGRAWRQHKKNPSTERCRHAVSKAIRRALQKLSVVAPQATSHLRTTIHCGYVCAYLPDPTNAPEWVVEW